MVFRFFQTSLWRKIGHIGLGYNHFFGGSQFSRPGLYCTVHRITDTIALFYNGTMSVKICYSTGVRAALVIGEFKRNQPR